MPKLISLPFNPAPSTIIHLDLNSCFATIEQQANPFLRGRPIAVAAYPSPGGCILAPSIEAKKFGVKTGMRVKEGQTLCPDLLVLPPDPNKYRSVHLAMKGLLQSYTARLTPKSIDEFVLDLVGSPAYQKTMRTVALEIKKRVKEEIGQYLTVSVGIAPNRFLAKTAAGLHKPDGLDEINKDNFRQIYTRLALTDLCGIKTNNAIRLNQAGIYTVMDFYHASPETLKMAFHSITGFAWHRRLHGYEADDVIFGRHSYGNSYALPKPLSTPEELAPILAKLVEKTGLRMRQAHYCAHGVHVALFFRDGSYWHHGQTQPKPLFDSRDIYRTAFKILSRCPYRKPVHTLSESCFNLTAQNHQQLTFLDNGAKKERLVAALDEINNRWGMFTIIPALMLTTGNLVPDRIAFGNVKELEEIVLK